MIIYYNQMSELVKDQTRGEVSEHHHELHKKVQQQRQQPVAPPAIPPAPQHSVVGLNCFNSTSKISNANWESTLQDEIIVNEGDSIFVKNAYIDTRNQTSQNVLIEEDTIIELEYYFYYINRGGSNVPSIYQDFAPFAETADIVQQLRAGEVSAAGITLPKSDEENYTLDNNLPYYIVNNPPVSGDVFFAPNGNDQTQANLARVTETIYYATNIPPASPNISAAYSTFLNTYTKQQLRTNPMGFIMPQCVGAADGLPYLLTTVTPDNGILPYPDNNPDTQLAIVFAAAGAPDNNFLPPSTWSAQPAPPTIPMLQSSGNTLGNISTATFFLQCSITITWSQITGLYSFSTSPPFPNIICATGIAVGQTITIPGTVFGGTSPSNDCTLTVTGIIPSKTVPLYINMGVQSSPLLPLSTAISFSISGNAIGFPPPINPPNPPPYGNVPSVYKAPDKIVPFTKKWKMLIPAGSYSPDYIATYVSRGMAIQKQKIQRAYAQYTGPAPQNVPPIFNSLITPVQLTCGQFPLNTGPGIQSSGDTIVNLADLPLGAWTSNNYFQPDLYYASKNPNSYPNPPFRQFNDAPYDPDFNSPFYNDNDDQPFLFRPFAFTNQFGFDTTDAGLATGFFYTGGGDIITNNVINFRLTLNNANLQDYNSMPSEENARPATQFDPNIDMMYVPFLTDVQSPFYYFTESGFNSANPPLATATPPDMTYGIRPIYSTMSLADLGGDAGNAKGLSYVPDISTPIVGASEMSLTWNDEGSNLFALPFLHNPLYSKPDPTTDEVQSSVAKIPSSFCFGQQLNPANIVKGVVQCDRQSGILLKSMTSKTRSGKPGLFWEKLGFVPADICVKTDASGNPICDYKTFMAKTTGGFSGSANIYAPQYNVHGTGEICYAPAEDLFSFGGWYASNAGINPFPVIDDFSFITNYNTLYYTVQNTTSIYAKSSPQNPDDTGHFLIELQAWSMEYCNENDKKQVKSVVSSYFVSSNSFVSQIGPESFQYYHMGSSLTISTIKVRILNPRTMQEAALIGPNSSVYVQFVRQPTQSNIIVGPSL